MATFIGRSPGALYVSSHMASYRLTHPDLTYEECQQNLLQDYENLDDRRLLRYQQTSENFYQFLKGRSETIMTEEDNQIANLSSQLADLCDTHETWTVRRKLQRFLAFMLVELNEMPNHDDKFSCDQLEDLYGTMHGVAHCIKKIILQIEPEYFLENEDDREEVLTRNPDISTYH